MEEIKKLLDTLSASVKAKDAAIEAKAGSEEVKELEGKVAEVQKSLDEALKDKESREDVIKEMTDRLDLVEKAVSSEGASKDGNKDEAYNTYYKAYNSWLRNTDQKISKDILDNFNEALVQKELSYASEEVKEEVKKELSKRTSSDGYLVIVKENKTYNTTIESQGGLFVPVDRNSEISTIAYETSNVRAIASQMTVSGDMLETVLDDEDFLDPIKVAEQGADTVGDVTDFGMVKVEAHAKDKKVAVTSRMLEDAQIDIASWITSKARDKFARAENTDFVLGAGIKEAKGILTYENWAVAGTYERNKFESVTIKNKSTSALEEFDWTDLLDLTTALKAEYLGKASFAMNRFTWSNVVKMRDADGRPLLETAIIQNGVEKRLFGYPVRIWEDMPNGFDGSGAVVGAKAVLFGDFSDYMVVDKRGLRIVRDELTEYPNVAYKFRKRVGGGAVGFDRIKVGIMAAAT